VATTQVEINYNELKRVVMAVFSYGMQLRAPNLTFSHGNTGNEFLELAARIDKFVSDLEPRHLLLLVATERLEETVKSAREDRQRQFETIRDWQKFAHELGNILGIQGTTDNYLEAVNSLKTEAGRLAHINDKLIARERRGRKRFSAIERAVDKVNAKPGRDRTSRKRVADRRRS
jgi:hypothetical protein